MQNILKNTQRYAKHISCCVEYILHNWYPKEMRCISWSNPINCIKKYCSKAILDQKRKTRSNKMRTWWKVNYETRQFFLPRSSLWPFSAHQSATAALFRKPIMWCDCLKLVHMSLLLCVCVPSLPRLENKPSSYNSCFLFFGPCFFFPFLKPPCRSYSQMFHMLTSQRNRGQTVEPLFISVERMLFAVERLFFAVDRGTLKNHEITPQTSGVQKWSGNS